MGAPLRQKAGETLVNNDELCYFMELSSSTNVILPMDVLCNLIYLVERLVLINIVL